jgi:hypothetical protein
MLDELLYKRKAQRTKLGQRRLRLFAVACCRRSEHLIGDPGLRDLLDAAERCADGGVTGEALEKGRSEHPPAYVVVSVPVEDTAHQRRLWAEHSPESLAGSAAWHCCSGTGRHAIIGHAHAALALGVEGYADEIAAQADVLRDIFGNPYRRPPAVAGAWRTSTAAALARRMYDTRDFSAMPILADALQDAGCESAEILDHCRGPGPHVRGCWVVDLVLGKG